MILRKEVFLEVCPDNKRDKATLLSIIKRRVAPGTKVCVENIYIHAPVSNMFM